MAPRLPATPRKSRAASPTTSSDAPKRTGPAPAGDNSARGEEAERVQLISFVAQLTQAEAEIESAKGPLKAAQKKRSGIVNLAKAAGFTAQKLKKRMEEMNRPSSENEADFAEETRHRRWLGITSPEQQKMHLEGNTPKESMDELDWQARGYRDGLRGLEAKPPEGCPPRMDQPYLKGHEKGRAESLAAIAANAPKPLGTAAKVREQAAKDFAEDNKPEPGTPEAAAAERKAVSQARAALEANLPKGGPDAAADPEAGCLTSEGEAAKAGDAEEVV
ncbi:MAG TPA: hypothetical protein VJP88_05850 [Caulobacteraceae bacterium]|nr:hypothetical protein [Caulobacteraceae bacterium]